MVGTKPRDLLERRSWRRHWRRGEGSRKTWIEDEGGEVEVEAEVAVDMVGDVGFALRREMGAGLLVRLVNWMVEWGFGL